MKFINVKTSSEMALEAAKIISDTVKIKPDAVLGLATGSTPIETYSLLCDYNKKGLVDFSDVKTVNLDEYIGLDINDRFSFAYFMYENLFSKINIKRENIHIPNGKADDAERECTEYDRLIESLSGIDLQLLGIGHDGHIGFNEPSDRFIYNTHTVFLNDMTIKANSRFFESESEVPRSAITMGIKAITDAKKIVLIAGKDKKEILYKALYGETTPEIPASAIKNHPDLTVILSEE